MSFEEFGNLSQTGFQNREPTRPEDEFFHSVYISGISRKNSSGITEQAEKLQIRGVEYNLESLNMMIIHTKVILAKLKIEDKKEVLQCFSYQEGLSPKGTSGITCGKNAAERATNDYCVNCRSQIIMAGIYCNEKGDPIADEQGKPIFVFLRGKGMKYSAIADYLSECSKRDDLEPFFNPATSESLKFEKAVVNNKRAVTKIGIDTVDSKYGLKRVFKLQIGESVSNKSTMDILKLAKRTLDKFNEKMNWANNMTYVDNEKKENESKDSLTKVPESTDTIENETVSEEKKVEKKEETPKKQSEDDKFSFDDIAF